MQGQEYLFAKWALGLRLGPETTDAEIEQAFEEGRILRTHVMRPTWHFVTPEDIHWLLDLTAPRVKMAMASNLRQEALDSRLLTRATATFERALGGGHHLTRAELKARLAAARMQLNARQMWMTCMQAELDGVICSGPRRGKQFTYALLSERAPAGRRLSRDESLGELAARYFATHGPATVRDFVWWSGLKTADARRALDIIKARAVLQDGLTYWVMRGARPIPPAQTTVHLLPIYDEFIVAYRDRVAVPHAPATARALLTSVTFRHALVIDSYVTGTRPRQRATVDSWKPRSGWQ